MGEATAVVSAEPEQASGSRPRKTREYLYYPQTFEPLALIEGGKGAPSVYHYHNDPNGCPTRLTDVRGEVKWAARYTAWGGIAELYADEVKQPIRLQGQYADAETGLYYNRHRYFDAEAGQFVSADPLGLGAGENVYEFARNTAGWVDPLGLLCGKLRKKLRSIEDLAQSSGDKGIRTALTPRELRKLGEEFVGDGHTIARGRRGELWLISQDGKRMFRAPTPKSSPYARTGKQANFHQRNNVNQNWFDDGSVSNVHVHSK